MDAQFPPFASAVFPRRTDVILDVAATKNAARVHILEARENVGRALSRDVRHHVQAPAMAHPSTNCSAPAAAPTEHRSSKGITAVTPSSENLLLPK